MVLFKNFKLTRLVITDYYITTYKILSLSIELCTLFGVKSCIHVYTIYEHTVDKMTLHDDSYKTIITLCDFLFICFLSFGLLQPTCS